MAGGIGNGSGMVQRGEVVDQCGQGGKGGRTSGGGIGKSLWSGGAGLEVVQDWSGDSRGKGGKWHESLGGGKVLQ